MDQRIVDLHEQYAHGGLSRREFFERLAEVAGGAVAAVSFLSVLENNYAMAQTIAENDSRLTVERVQYEGPDGRISGYLAQPKGPARTPAVIVIHENRGLNPHIQDVARRLAVEGFTALAPDLLSTVGGTPADPDEATSLINGLKPPETLARTAAAVPFLAKRAGSTGKVGVVGFCWGGGVANQLAAAGTSLNAAVSYYGMQIPAAQVPKISAPLLLHYASLDQRIDAGIGDYEAALNANNKTYEKYMYEGANHAFNNDTNAARYNKEAATLAWSRTISFFKKYLT